MKIQRWTLGVGIAARKELRFEFGTTQ